MRVLLMLMLVLAPLSAKAQAFPSKPVRIVVPYAAGGATDALARALAQRFGESWSQQVLVDNRPGGNTLIGTEYVVKSPPDGHTLLLTAEATIVVNPAIYARLPYHPARDLAPVSGLVAVNQALVVNEAFAARTVREFIEAARSRPGALSYASFGTGSTGHLNMEMFQAMAGVQLNHVQYKGAAPAITDVVAGHVPAMFVSVGVALPHLRSGKVRMLAIGTLQRHPLYKDTPTVAETLPGFEATSWFGLFAPAATPREAVLRVNAEAQKALADAAFRDKHTIPQGLDPIAGSPEAFAQFIRSETDKWGRVVRAAKIRID